MTIKIPVENQASKLQNQEEETSHSSSKQTYKNIEIIREQVTWKINTRDLTTISDK
jgi:hypothetical protein